MALSWQQRQECLGPLLARLAARVPKDTARATVDAVDDWLDANANSYNLAIPQPARSIMTAAEKLELLYILARKRWGG